ncbi:MAPEG family protein [Rhizobiaceae bacterium BDR2-2]|uniref:MAPEG family protein n=1 Tax=Ectorhizobium quercum TaxID=2965071 RepID=A0AAE3SWZ4_9HYPH|nr:MAPEG family protein [Ectorhizobium quercum]MCX8999233.1 MAPEG family protein [Ectorhizobium quercum]
MEMLPATATVFATLAAWSVVLLVAHILLQGFFATRELGSAWNAGPRDEGRKPEGVLAGRAGRASANLRETYPAFPALCLALAVTGDPSGWGLIGAYVWFAARIIYLPLYLAGIPYIRSLVWLGSLAGLAAMFLSVVL